VDESEEAEDESEGVFVRRAERASVDRARTPAVDRPLCSVGGFACVCVLACR
jgi:hypothetical protein